ncbi:MAG: hypothetical protein NZ747_04685 [Nitrosopumilus sp.]|nr:hypothetical protein [Nitrosopumilus sp.]
MASFQSERLMHFPNVNSLMKLSLGLVFFTIISTALVYAETIPVTVDETSFDVQYSSTGMSVTGIESDTESMSLIFSVDVVDLTGTLDVTFEREFFDSIYDGADDLFFILADGDEAISEETETTSQSRSLSIKVPSGTEELEIIGSAFDNSKSFEFVLVEEPAVEEPAVEEPAVENVLDNSCGPGTILEDGVCVLESTSASPGTPSPVNNRELIASVTIAFVIAGIVGIFLGLIAKANKNKN